ncbi:MAG TPA: Smr/MutS family protein [Bacteroidia bacterium]|nr:Smr/MutS family protein [Bacteroidia bacterium]
MKPLLKPGDKVSFLNEKQSGIVTSVINSALVKVDIGDGFEIPTPVNELVLIVIESMPATKPEVESNVSPSPTVVSRMTLLTVVPDGDLTFFVAPAEGAAVSSGPVCILIANRSGFEFTYSCFALKKKAKSGINRGIVENNSVVILGSFTREELIDISGFLVNGFFYATENLSDTGPVRKEVPVLAPGFQESLKGPEGSYAFAKSFTLFQAGLTAPEDAELLKEKFSGLKERFTRAPQMQSGKKRRENTEDDSILITERIVDLHIEELIKDVSALSNSEMIGLQLKKFHSEMNAALKGHIKRLILIHGVGNGTLKKTIRDELRNYPGVAFRDGDYQKFGSGATEVLFR